MQQGGCSSPFDRNMGIQLALKAISWLEEQLKRSSNNKDAFKDEKNSCVVIGLKTQNYKFSSAINLAKETNFERRIPKHHWWIKLRPLLRILAKHDSTYYDEGAFTLDEDFDDEE